MPAPESFRPNVEALYIREGLSAVPLQTGSTLALHEVADVVDYPSPGSKSLDEHGVPYAFRYPGQRPPTSFAVIGSHVEACATTNEDGVDFYINTSATSPRPAVYNLNDLLRSAEAATMEDRYPVIAFGSNANPGQLAQKFKKLEGADQVVVPTLMATVKQVVPVYAARIGINGYVFTDLVPAGEDAESKVHVNFLSYAQLEAMDATEKAYSLCEIPDVKLETQDGKGYQTAAYLYVGREDSQGANILTDDLGRPIRLAEIEATGENLETQFATMSQAEAQRYIFEIAGALIADTLRLPDTLADEVDLAKLIINRKDEPRLAAFRAHVKANEGNQPLGRMVGKYIQQAISETGMTTPASGLRRVIPKASQDIELSATRTLHQLQNT